MKSTGSPVETSLSLIPKSARGARLRTVTTLVTECVPPSSSVTVRRTVLTPLLAIAVTRVRAGCVGRAVVVEVPRVGDDRPVGVARAGREVDRLAGVDVDIADAERSDRVAVAHRDVREGDGRGAAAVGDAQADPAHPVAREADARGCRPSRRRTRRRCRGPTPARAACRRGRTRSSSAPPTGRSRARPGLLRTPPSEPGWRPRSRCATPCHGRRRRRSRAGGPCTCRKWRRCGWPWSRCRRRRSRRCRGPIAW